MATLRTLSAEEFILIANAHGRGVAFRRVEVLPTHFVTFPVLAARSDRSQGVAEELLKAWFRFR